MITALEWIRASWGGFLFVRLFVLILGCFTVWMACWYTPESPPPGLVCLVKQTTGYPCPACGITRGLTAFCHGRIAEAHQYFPLIIPVMLGLIVALTGAVLPDKIWNKLVTKTWLVWIICSGAGITAIGILSIWVSKLM